MALITKNPIKIVLIIILLLLAYNMYSNKQGNVISYGLIILGVYLIFNDSFLENMVDTNYENPDIEKLLKLDINSLFNSSDEPLSQEEIKKNIDEQVEQVIKTKLNDTNLSNEAESRIPKDQFIEDETKKLVEEGKPIEDAKNEAQNNYQKVIETEKTKLKEEYSKSILEAKEKLNKEAIEEQNKRMKEKDTIAKVNQELTLLEESREELKPKSKELTLEEQREFAKKLFGESNKIDEEIKKLQSSKEQQIKTIQEETPESSCDANIAKAIAPLQAEISKLREKTAIPPDVKEAKLKNFTLLVETLIEKGALTDEEYEQMKTKLDSNVLTLDDAISALEKLKRASKNIKKTVSGQKDKWWSDMNKSELPMEMYIPKGEQIDNKWSNEFTILNTDKWTVPMPRPPVCIDSSPKDIMPMGTSGYPMSLKYYDAARYVSTSAKMEKAKREIEEKTEDVKIPKDVKERFTNWI